MKFFNSDFMKNSAIVLVGNSFAKLVIYIINFYLAFQLGTSEYGNYSYYQNTIMTLASVGLLGLSSSANYFVSTSESKEISEKYTIVILTLTTFFFVLASVAYQLIKGNISLVIILISYFSIIYAIFQGVMSGSKSFLENTSINVISALVFGGVIFLISPQNHDHALQAFYQYRTILLLLAVIWFIYFIKKNDFSYQIVNLFDTFKKYSVPVLKFTLPVALSSMMVAPVLWYGYDFLIDLPNGAEQLGLYSLGYQVYLFIVFIPGVLSNLYLSYLSSIDSKGFNKLIGISLLVNITSVIFISLIVHIALVYFLPKYNSDYLELNSFINYFYISALVYSLNSVIGQRYISKGKTWFSFFFNSTWGGSYILCVNYIVPYLGGEGLAVALLISYCTQSVVQLFTILFQNYFLAKTECINKTT